VTSVPGTPAEPVVYERRADGWVQYWFWFDSNPQDRGVLRSGRHAGDWELVQYREDGSEAVYSQHSGAERCGSFEVRDGRPVVYVANGAVLGAMGRREGGVVPAGAVLTAGAGVPGRALGRPRGLGTVGEALHGTAVRLGRAVRRPGDGAGPGRRPARGGRSRRGAVAPADVNGGGRG
jgi:hypothetical protein